MVFILVSIVIVISNGVLLLNCFKVCFVLVIILMLLEVCMLIIYIFIFVVVVIVLVIVFGILWNFRFKNILKFKLISFLIKLGLKYVNIFLFILRWYVLGDNCFINVRVVCWLL